MPVDPRRIEVLDPLVVEIFRAKTPTERVALACDANQTARLLLKAHLISLQPDWSADHIEQAIAERMLHGAA